MAGKKKRFTISVDEETYQELKALTQAARVSLSSGVGEMLGDMLPVIRVMRQQLEEARNAPGHWAESAYEMLLEGRQKFGSAEQQIFDALIQEVKIKKQ